MKIKLTPLDKLFSHYIRTKADDHCEYCGVWKDTRDLQTSHFHGRRKRSTRWLDDNCCALCFSCHLYLGENPHQHCEFFKKRLGTDRFEKLNIRAETTHPKPDLELITAQLKEKIKMLSEVD